MLLEARAAALVEGAIPQEAVKARLNESFVAVAIDCDQPDPEVQQLGALHMPSARSLSFVFYTDADGQFLHGTSGSRCRIDWLRKRPRIPSRPWRRSASAYADDGKSHGRPICSDALREHGFEPDIEPTHTKMGHLIKEAAERASAILRGKAPWPTIPHEPPSALARAGIRGRCAGRPGWRAYRRQASRLCL